MVARFLGVVLIVVLAAPEWASAQPPIAKQARDLFLEGVELSKNKEWAEALEKFDQSIQLVERASSLFNRGVVLLKLDRPTEAIASFDRFYQLAGEGDDALRASADRMVAEAKQKQGQLELEVSPEDAAVRIDGALADSKGPVRHYRLDPGRHVFELSAAEHDPVRAEIELTAGQPSRFSLTLMRHTPLARAPTQAQPKPIALTPAVETQPESDDGDGLLASPWFWGAVGVGAVALSVVLAVSLSGVEDPYTGSADAVLIALERR